MAALILPRSTVDTIHDRQNKAYPYEAHRYGSGSGLDPIKGGASDIWNQRVRGSVGQPPVQGQGWQTVNGRRRWINMQPSHGAARKSAKHFMPNKARDIRLSKQQWRAPTRQQAMLAHATMQEQGGGKGKK